jgi:hypothetical protein
MSILFITVVALTVNGILSHIVAGTAREKKIGYSTTFWVSFLLSPLFGLLLSIASPVDTKVEKEVEKTEPEPYVYVEKPEDKGAKILFNVFTGAFVLVAAFMIYTSIF